MDSFTLYKPLVAVSFFILFSFSASAAEQEDPVLEEVVVVAQKREQSLQEVPIAITAFTEEMLRVNSIFGLEGIAARTPNFVMTNVNPVEPNFYIRGIGTEGLNSNAGGDSSVAQFIDGVYISRGGGSNFDLFDIERIEVLRGPQGTLFGKNTVGGLIHVITSKPSEERRARAELTVGNLDRLDFRGMFSGPLSERLFFKISFSARQRDGYIFNETSGRWLFDQDSTAARAALRFVANDDLEMMLTVDGVRERQSGQPRTNLSDPSVNDGIHAIGNPDPQIINAQEDGWNDRDISGITLDIDWDTSIGNVASITAFRDSEYDIRHGFFSVPVTPTTIESTNHNIEKAEQFSQELRLGSKTPDDRFDWVVGLYYLREEIERDETLIQEFQALVPVLNGVASFPQDVTSTSFALFGQFSWRFADSFNFTLGGRYTWEDKDVRLQGHLLSGIIAPPLVSDFDVSTKEDWSAFTPRVALDYFISDDKMIYGSISRGFKSGGFQGTPPTGEIAEVPYDEEFAWAYEIGTKTRWLEDRLQLNLAVFRTDHEDLQVAELIAGDRIVIGNAAEAKIKGVELEFMARPIQGLTFNGSYAYLDAEFSSFSEGATADNTGNTLPRSPEHALNLAFQYDWTFGNLGTASARLDWSYQDDFFFEASNTPNEVQEAYDTWDARLALTSPNGEWEVALWGKNLSDELIKTHSVAFAPFGQELVSYAEPRTYGVTVSWFMR